MRKSSETEFLRSPALPNGIRAASVAMFVGLLALPCLAQGAPSVAEGRQAAGKDATPVAAKPADLIPAVLPKQDPNLIFVEGEDAVSTNFAREPVLNYDCSAYRTLQLNQSAALKSSSAYFADFSFYVESTGTYELWYGGTPPAGQDASQVSYTSPFSLVLDKTSTFEIYRENVHVVENYTPAYYWNLVGDFPLLSGSHRLRFEVSKPRSYDGKYFFYLDNFFLIKKENGKRLPVAVVPAVFPHDMDNRSIDKYFASIDEYERRIKANPNDVQADLDAATVYSLIGDYYNALKYLRRADLLDPQQKTTMLLMAKNTLWKGDSTGAIALYKKLLQYYGDDLGIWLEAGKIAAWTGHYADSVSFFSDALKRFPKDLSIIVNRGLSELWSGSGIAAKQDFDTALQLTGNEVARRKALASIYSVNGYPDRAATIYRGAMAVAPGDVELYTLLYDTLQKENLPKEAQAVRAEMDARFVPSPELTAYLDVFDKKEQLRSMVLDDYRKQLATQPDNLELRKIIAEAAFWNGDMDGGIKDYEGIVANYTYRQVRAIEKSAAEYLGLLDRALSYSRYLADLPQKTAQLARNISERLADLRKASADLDRQKAADADLLKKGKQPDPALQTTLSQILTKAQSDLGSALDAASAFVATAGVLADRFKADQDRELVLSGEDGKLETTFRNLTKDTKWRWNRAAMEKELEKARDNGTSLATYALGRIALLVGDAQTARDDFAILAKDENPLPGVPYGLLEARLGLGQLPAAEAVRSAAPGSDEPFATLRDDLAGYLDVLGATAPSTPGFLDGDPNPAVAAGLKDLATLRDGSFARKRAADSLAATLRGILARMTERSFYDLAVNTSATHNELGDFYQTAKRYADSIDQFRQVMAIDPWNREAIFKLGQVYQYNGNWSEAQALYRKVFNDDPYYNNVAHFYNQIERQYADEIDASTRTFVDSSRYSLFDSIGWGTHVNEALGVTGTIASAYQRFPIAPASASLSERATAALPLTPFGASFSLTPYVGGLAASKLAGSGTVPVVAGVVAAVDPLSFLESFTPRFLGGLDVAWSGTLVSASLGYDYDTIEDTLTRGAPLYAQTAQAGATLRFSFTGLPVIGDSSLRGSGSTQFVEDGALIWSAGGELLVPLTLSNVPHVVLTLDAPASYQDSQNVPAQAMYYAPRQALTTEGALALVGDFDVMPGFSIRQTLRGSVGYYGDVSLMPNSATVWAHTDNVTFSLESRSDFSTESYTAYVDLVGSGKNQNQPVATVLGYWNLALEIGLRFRAPTFLVP